jgi:PPOX class probable F420-dependent enzyme
MPYNQMDDWMAFARSPVRPAILSTVRADGRPHSAPIWFDLDDDGTVVFNTGVGTIKGRNLARDPRVALVVQDDRPPYSFVLIEGRAELSDDLAAVRTWAARIGGRYMGEDRAEEFGRRNGVPGELVVRVTPASVVAKEAVAD